MQNDVPKTRSGWLTGIVLLGVLAASGCLLAPPVPPTPLTAAQITKVENCQNAVTAGGRKFVNAKLSKLETCVQEVLKWRLPFESALIDQAELDAKLVETRAKCQNLYTQITKASTTFVNSVVAKCTPVAEFVLGPYDALSFQALADAQGRAALASVEELAGLLCGVKEVFVDVNLTAQVPRALELLSYLGDDFVTIDTTNQTGFPKVALDSRCVNPGVTPPVRQSLSPFLQRGR